MTVCHNMSWPCDLLSQFSRRPPVMHGNVHLIGLGAGETNTSNDAARKLIRSYRHTSLLSVNGRLLSQAAKCFVRGVCVFLRVLMDLEQIARFRIEQNRCMRAGVEDTFLGCEQGKILEKEMAPIPYNTHNVCYKRNWRISNMTYVNCTTSTIDTCQIWHISNMTHDTYQVWHEYNWHIWDITHLWDITHWNQLWHIQGITLIKYDIHHMWKMSYVTGIEDYIYRMWYISYMTIIT